MVCVFPPIPSRPVRSCISFCRPAGLPKVNREEGRQGGKEGCGGMVVVVWRSSSASSCSSSSSSSSCRPPAFTELLSTHAASVLAASCLLNATRTPRPCQSSRRTIDYLRYFFPRSDLTWVWFANIGGVSMYLLRPAHVLTREALLFYRVPRVEGNASPSHLELNSCHVPSCLCFLPPG
ncbi:hypothetical protein E2C01_005740 [Portunus trituberculatus]|uniref:Uncharacterized protein n=1 Tax=Portunus trituberculatus TaxID=210409 RepID=A0A5B7CTG9_PORTR|nr:hypothetical protein [Portunus trituberculatus]